ncbi:EAL domain-containing protein [Rhodoferax saidenbachensis]|uniref:Diguanylate cyclase (GGDEF)-like protein n=1 Tax=Rhodoferax saidenbachensis TaxID=1484693 RepID=A0ABU1ZSZ4_9BURK|nr:EAL domain-containing protein [Rhodoferax saidenbachensis]MDR7308676.1 diguanylate cyclase (GGDEF)-like protein [Rhodoferax saidenbachensis]
MKYSYIEKIDRVSLDRYIKSASRYYVGAFAAITIVALIIYAAMQLVLDRHSVQQNVSFLTSNQFIKFQQLANTARALMRASADEAIPSKVLDKLTEEMQHEIIELSDINAQLLILHHRLDENSAPSDLDLRLQTFLERAERLADIDHISRGRRYAFWGPIDFATASDGFIMRSFQEQIQKSFSMSEASIGTAKNISALLILSPLVALFIVGVFVLMPLLKKLRTEYERKKIFEQELSIRAHRDELTNLPNRMSFNQMFDRLVKVKEPDEEYLKSDSFVLLLIDLDHFKSVNDIFGHQTGDALLVEAAKRISSALEDGSFAARLGGDEFAILLPNFSNPAEAEEVALRIRKNLSKPFTTEGHTLRISGSIGGAMFPDHGTSAGNIIRCADLALYAAKTKRNNVIIFNEEMMADRLAESELRTALFKAVENEDLVVYYQPKINIQNNQLAFEALVRWPHPEFGILSPGRFLHLFNTGSSITSMTECVVNQVAQDIRRWRDKGLSPGSVAINMPEAILISGMAFDMLAHAVERHALKWSDFSIEITEDVFMSKYTEQISATVVKLRELGVSIALDDFGTGFASLTNLRDFPFDDIKIDRSFIFNIGVDEKSEQIIKSMIDLARNLGNSSIAEGVETEAQLLFLQQAGCNIVQGYFFAQPQPFETVTRGLELGEFPYDSFDPAQHRNRTTACSGSM